MYPPPPASLGQDEPSLVAARGGGELITLDEHHRRATACNLVGTCRSDDASTDNDRVRHACSVSPGGRLTDHAGPIWNPSHTPTVIPGEGTSEGTSLGVYAVRPVVALSTGDPSTKDRRCRASARMTDSIGFSPRRGRSSGAVYLRSPKIQRSRATRWQSRSHSACAEGMPYVILAHGSGEPPFGSLQAS